MTEKIKNICIIVLVILCIIFIGTTIYNKKNKDIAENNVEALMDSVRTYQLSNDELLYAKKTLILEKNQLEEYLDISKSEVKELEKKLDSKITYISKIQGQIRVDTLRMVDSVYVVNDTINAHFKYNDEWLSLNGLTNCYDNKCNTSLNDLSLKTPIKIGLTEDHQLFATSQCPYLSFTSIDGADVSKQNKPKKWNLGVSLTVGPTVGYGLVIPNSGTTNGGIFAGVGAMLGVSVSYKLLEW